MSNVACRGRRAGRGASLPLNANPGISTFSADTLTVTADNTTVATLTVTAKDNDGTVLVGATVVATRTNASNSTMSTPAVTNSSGQTTFTLKASAAATRVVTITINGIPVTGSVSIVFSAVGQTIDRTKSTVSLQGASANVGDPAVLVTLQGIDTTDINMASGGSTVVFGVSGGTSVVSVSATTDVGNGTYTATITPTTAGTATTLTCTIDGLSVTTTMPTFTVTSASYAAGDILNNFGFENTWDVQASPRINAFNNGAAATPTGAASFNTTQKYAGTYSLYRTLPVTSVSDVSANVYCMFGQPSTGPFWYSPDSPANQGGHHGVDRLYGRFWYYLTNAMDGTLKFNIFEEYGSTSAQYGGLYFSAGKLGWCFAQEWSTQIHPIRALSTIGLNGWHSVEWDYWRKGDPSGYPSVALWIDDVAVTSGVGSPPSPGAWTSGRLNAGERVGDSALSYQLGLSRPLGVLNGSPANTIASEIWIDRYSLSTTGRVGP